MYIKTKVPKDLKTWTDFHWINEQKYKLPAKELMN